MLKSDRSEQIRGKVTMENDCRSLSIFWSSSLILRTKLYRLAFRLNQKTTNWNSLTTWFNSFNNSSFLSKINLSAAKECFIKHRLNSLRYWSNASTRIHSQAKITSSLKFLQVLNTKSSRMRWTKNTIIWLYWSSISMKSVTQLRLIATLFYRRQYS